MINGKLNGMKCDYGKRINMRIKLRVAIDWFSYKKQIKKEKIIL